MVRLFKYALLLTQIIWCCFSLAADISPELESNILNRIALKQNPGFIIGIIDEDGERFYGYGEAELNKGKIPNKNTLYEIGSISKTFTSLLLAEMVIQDEINLNDPVQKYLPENVSLPQRNGAEITFEHLSTHYSGLPRLPNNFSPKNVLNPYADYTVEDLYSFLSEYKLERDIDSLGEYSNLGVGLLGHTLALINKTSFEQSIRNTILAPLGMNDTAITLDERLNNLLAPPYQSLNQQLGKVQNWDLPTLAGAGALRSNAKDMLAYLAANISLTNTVLRQAMDLSHEPRRAFGKDQIGLGWIVRKKEGETLYFHNGGTGGYRSFSGFSKEKQRGVVVLTNSTTSPDDIGLYLLNSTYPLMEYKKRVEISLTPQALSKFVGLYELSPDFFIEVTVNGDEIYLQATDQPKFQAFPESDTDFFLKVVDAKINFKLNNDGDVESLVLKQNGQEIPGKKIK